MKYLLMITWFCCLQLVFTSSSAQARKKADKATREWRYETQCMGIGVEGTKLIKVWSYSKKPNVAVEQSKKNAVHAMIFQGFAGNSGNGCPTQKPLVDNPAIEQKKANYFESFFDDGGRYMKFITVSGDGAVRPSDVMKVGKEYKIGVIVSVMYDQLRKELETAGVIRGLSSGF